MKCQAEGWSKASVRVWTPAGPVFVPQGDPRVGTVPLGASVEIDFAADSDESAKAAGLVAGAVDIGRRQAARDAAAQTVAEYETEHAPTRGEAARMDELMDAAD